MACESVNSQVGRAHARYNNRVFPVSRSLRTTWRRFTMRAATLLLAAIVTMVGLWGVSHTGDVALSTPAASSSTVVTAAVDATVDQLIDTTEEASVSESKLIGIVTCLLGLLCGFALAILIFFALRCRQIRFQCQRPQIARIAAPTAFDHRGRHHFNLHELSLLRI